MKVCIITYEEYINIPYVERYEMLLRDKNIEYDIILWDRRDVIRYSLQNQKIFRCYVPKYKIFKAYSFIRWRRFCLRTLSENNYDKLIVLTTMPAVLLSDVLFKKYRFKYIFDIRDYTYEKYRFYKRRVNLLVKNSYYTFISSPQFKKWLDPNAKISVTHNITNDNIKYDFNIDLQKSKLVFAFVGGIRYFNENIIILKALANIDFIELKYIGKTHLGVDLYGFCKENSINNVKFEGVYCNEQKPDIYKNIDLINSIYGSGSPEVTTALPNKLYDCVLFNRPIVVSSNTYLAEVVNKYNLGFDIDIYTDDIEYKIKEYIKLFDLEKFLKGCEDYKNDIKCEMNDYMGRICDFIADEEG